MLVLDSYAGTTTSSHGFKCNDDAGMSIANALERREFSIRHQPSWMGF
jgi:hypothetical protein